MDCQTQALYGLATIDCIAGAGTASIEPECSCPENNTQVVPADEGGSLQDFFNDASTEDRPIIDAP